MSPVTGKEDDGEMPIECVAQCNMAGKVCAEIMPLRRHYVVN
jgi:hypothetical protein